MSASQTTTSRIGDSLARLAEIARHQHGVFTHEQALACGVSTRTIHRDVAEGRWRRLHRGVYVAASRGVDDVQRACAAVLGAGDSAILSHMSAIALHDLAPWPLHVHLTVPHGRHRRLDGVRWHQSRVLGDDDRTIVRGIRATTVERSLLDAATQADPKLTGNLVDECVRLGKSDIVSIAAKALEVRPDGRFGGSKLRSVLAHAPPVEAPDRLDFAFPHVRLDVECDGAAYHAGPLSQARDRSRDEALRACGWRVLRFTWNDVTARAPATARRINDALAG